MDYNDYEDMVCNGFPSDERGLGEKLAEYVSDYREAEFAEDEELDDYFLNNLMDLYDAGSSTLFRFLAMYYDSGLDDAIAMEASDPETFEYILKTCKELSPDLDEALWREIFEEVEE